MLIHLAVFASHLRGKGASIALLFLLGLAGAACSLATPLIGKAFIDSVVGRGEYSLLPRLALLMLGLALADLTLGIGTRYLHARLSARVLVEIRERLLSRCLFAPLAEVEKYRHGDLLNRFGADIPKVQSLLVDGVLGFFQNLLFLVVAAVILLRLSATLALWSFSGLALALAVTTLFRKPVERGTRVVRDAMVDLGHFLTERLAALRAVRLHQAGEQDQRAFSALNGELVRRMLKFQLVDAASSGFPGLVLTAMLAWIYLVGGREIQSHAITAGTFVAFILYQGKLVAPATGLLGLVRSLQETRVSLERVAELLCGPSACEPPREGSPAGGIACRGVRFAYPGSPAVLDGVELDVVEGERAALFGSSGSGKSTLVQAIFGVRTPGEGSVRVGRAPDARLGYAGGEPFLLHATVAENLRYGNPGVHSEEKLREAALLAEAHGFIAELPQGYETVIGGRGQALSDGQRQRIGLARLILREPEIFVLDEAFSALDPETEAKVRRNLFSRFADRTFLVISHRLEGLSDFDALYLMEKGRVGKVAPAELRERLFPASLRAVKGGPEHLRNLEEEAPCASA